MVNYAMELDDIFGALASSSRRQILHYLSEGPQNISELAELLKLSLPAIHKHIKMLERAKLISRVKIGRSNTLSLRPETIQNAKQWLDYYEQFWNQQFNSLEVYINQIDRK